MQFKLNKINKLTYESRKSIPQSMKYLLASNEKSLSALGERLNNANSMSFWGSK